MSRGLSRRQRELLAFLEAAGRPLDVVGELGPIIGTPATASGRGSLLRSVRLLERRGLVCRRRRRGRVEAVATVSARRHISSRERQDAAERLRTDDQVVDVLFRWVMRRLLE